jgi:hypothetical protein
MREGFNGNIDISVLLQCFSSCLRQATVVNARNSEVIRPYIMNFANRFKFLAVAIEEESPPAIRCNIYVSVFSNINGNTG